MLDGFEDYTEDLTLEEKQQAQRLVEGFQRRVGKGNAISNRSIRSVLEGEGIKLTDAKVRKYISYVRICYLPHLCANSKGYYLAQTKEELKEYLKSSWQRISQQHAAYEVGMKKLEEW